MYLSIDSLLLTAPSVSWFNFLMAFGINLCLAFCVKVILIDVLVFMTMDYPKRLTVRLPVV